TGRPIFPPTRLRDVFIEQRGHRGELIEDEKGIVRWVNEPSGALTVFKAPSTDPDPRRYFVCGDPSMTTEGDPACIQVINRATMEQVAVWHGRVGSITFADEMMRVGKYYHTAML